MLGRLAPFEPSRRITSRPHGHGTRTSAAIEWWFGSIPRQMPFAFISTGGAADHDPNSKAVLVFDARTNQRLANVAAINVTNEAGDVVFQPQAAGEFFIYYLPVKLTGGAFPVSHYLAPADKADPAWKTRAGLADGGWKTLPPATVVRWESRSAHDAWNEMEIIATQSETATVAARFADQPVALFAEDAAHSVRMFDFLPARWVARFSQSPAQQPTLSGLAGGALPFQIVAWAHRDAVEQATIRFGDLIGPGGAMLPAARLTCVTSDGNDWMGRPLVRPTDIASGRLQPFWCVASPPADLPPGPYYGEATLAARTNGQPIAVKLRLTLEIGPATPAGTANRTTST